MNTPIYSSNADWMDIYTIPQFLKDVDRDLRQEIKEGTKFDIGWYAHEAYGKLHSTPRIAEVIGRMIEDPREYPPEYDLPDTSNSPPDFEAFDLDAFGHLSWVIGYGENESQPESRGDWIACADADAQHGWVGFHVVIDSDSGGFCDGSIDKGVITPDEADEQLPGLLDKWRDVASEHLSAGGHWFTDEETKSDLDAIERWRAKVTETVAEARKQAQA